MDDSDCATHRRRTADAPTAADAKAEVSEIAGVDAQSETGFGTQLHVTAREHGDELVVVNFDRDAAPLMDFARRHTDAFDLVAVGHANNTDDSASARFYTPADGDLEAIDAASFSVGVDGRQRANFYHDGLRAHVNI